MFIEINKIIYGMIPYHRLSLCYKNINKTLQKSQYIDSVYKKYKKFERLFILLQLPELVQCYVRASRCPPKHATLVLTMAELGVVHIEH